MFYVIVCNIVKTCFMKNILLLLVCLSVWGCQKSNNVTPSYSSAQIWDSVGIQYEKKYIIKIASYTSVTWIDTLNIPGDTLIFHSDSTITEHVYIPLHSGTTQYFFDTTLTIKVIPVPSYTPQGANQLKSFSIQYNNPNPTIYPYQIPGAYFYNDFFNGNWAFVSPPTNGIWVISSNPYILEITN